MMSIICAACISSAVAEVSDAQLRGILDRAVSYIDDPNGGPSEVRYALRLSEGDTNRVVSLMKQLVAEGTCRDGAAVFYISQIGKHGTCADLPFLYQRIATTNLCRTATEAVLEIEGLTTNSVTQITAMLPSGNGDPWMPMSAFCRLLEASEKLSAGDSVKVLLVSNAVCYASQLTSYVEMFDDCLRHADLTYHASKRRLTVLRAVRDLGVNEWQTNFVTRAIRELVAYPEANLPE